MRIQPDRLEETFATQVDDDSPSYGERQMADQPPLRPGPDGGRGRRGGDFGPGLLCGLFTGGGRQRHCSPPISSWTGARSERRFAAAPTSGTSGPAGPGGMRPGRVTTFGGSDNRLPVANGITGIVMPSAMHCRRSCQGIHFCSGDGRSDRNHGGSGIEPGLKQTGFPQF